MEIKINKEIRSYKETVYFGLTARKLICSLLAVGTAAWRSPIGLASRQPQGWCGTRMNRGQRNFLCPLFFMFRISDLSASCQGS
ncbi:MAG TPA: hypothetical protein DCX96_03465 [Oscillibacter sp.]|nr:hypothetical protein [Oscillibacter sp.]